MSSQNAPPSPPPPSRRRSSFVEMFNPRFNSTSAVSSSPPNAVPTSPSVPQHRRGTSITALGLTTNPNGQSPFSTFGGLQRRASVASSTASSSPEFKNSFGDEPAVIEEDETPRSATNPQGSPSFARRVSFGAQALRDVRLGGSPGASGGGRRPSSSVLSTLNENSENAAPSNRAASPTAKTSGKSLRPVPRISSCYNICLHILLTCMSLTTHLRRVQLVRSYPG
jgi:hypothetical protein